LQHYYSLLISGLITNPSCRYRGCTAQHFCDGFLGLHFPSKFKQRGDAYWHFEMWVFFGTVSKENTAVDLVAASTILVLRYKYIQNCVFCTTLRLPANETAVEEKKGTLITSQNHFFPQEPFSGWLLPDHLIRRSWAWKCTSLSEATNCDTQPSDCNNSIADLRLLYIVSYRRELNITLLELPVVNNNNNNNSLTTTATVASPCRPKRHLCWEKHQ